MFGTHCILHVFSYLAITHIPCDCFCFCVILHQGKVKSTYDSGVQFGLSSATSPCGSSCVCVFTNTVTYTLQQLGTSTSCLPFLAFCAIHKGKNLYVASHQIWQESLPVPAKPTL